MSTHQINIIEIAEVLPHENAERLEVIPVNGWQAISAKGNFKPGDRAVYIEPDYMVPTDHPEFSFLAKEGKTHHRLKAVRLRGKLSFGLLIPVPETLRDRPTGANVMEDLGIRRYVPPPPRMSGESLGNMQSLPEAEWPLVHAPKFDIETYQRYAHVIQPGEPVVITEKIHGANARYVYHEGIFYMGSRNRWLKSDADHIWSRAVTPAIRDWCQMNPSNVLYGEVYGPVQSLKYGLTQPKFVAFATYRYGSWDDLLVLFSYLKSVGTAVPHVPVLYEGPFDEAKMKELAEQDSVVAQEKGHMMEGVVVVPQQERFHADIGRVALKHISNRYWEFKD